MYRKHRSYAEQAYAEAFSEDKLAVQKHLAKHFYACCGEPKEAPHHPSCHNYVDTPAVIEGQESLL